MISKSVSANYVLLLDKNDVSDFCNSQISIMVSASKIHYQLASSLLPGSVKCERAVSFIDVMSFALYIVPSVQQVCDIFIF